MKNVVRTLAENDRLNTEKERNRKTRSPEDFNDPLALKISWNAKKYNSNSNVFPSFKRSFINPNRAKFSIAAGTVVLCSIFMILGLTAGVLCSWLLSVMSFHEGFIVGIAFGTLFFLVGLLILIFNLKPKTFDKNLGYYWEGWSLPHHSINQNGNTSVSIDQIYSIQLLKDCNQYFTNFELNLVLKDATVVRANHYPERKYCIKDAEALSEFLQIPIWDAS